MEVAEEIVTLDPLALSVAIKLLLVPTTTLPKFGVVGLTANWPVPVPVPDKAIVRVEFEAFEITERFPLALPLDFGAKVTLNVMLCPPDRLKGRFRPLKLKAAPVAVA